MDFKMVCGTWIKEEDEKVLEVLRKSERWMTSEELSEITGLPVSRIRTTLKLLKQQMQLAEGRKRMLKNDLN